VSTATVETSTDATGRRAASSRRRPLQDASRREITEVRAHTEAAVTDFVAATSDALRALLPSAMLRPTEAVDYSFDVAEQILAGIRRVCVEIATVIESGLQGAETRAA
jgi:hypothetical protein